MSQRNYGLALYALAKDEQLDKEILEQLQVLDTAFSQEPDFLRLLATPNLSKEERCALLDDSFRDRVHPYVLNFLKVLTEKGLARSFGDCCKAYRQQYNEDNDIISVLAVSAVALTREQSDKLKEKLSKVTGKTVELVCRVDPQCLGGIRLDYDGKRVDGTVKNRLDSLRNELMR
jgi:F-type H+-transporting ATPase subunit delta